MMLENDCGLPVLENVDFSSVAAMQRMADIADEMFRTQEESIDYLERPEVCIGRMSGSADYYSIGSNIQAIAFDTTEYLSRPGATISFGVFMNDNWRPGIYIAGAVIEMLTTGTLDSIYVDIALYDNRGPSYINSYVERERMATGQSVRGAESISMTRVFEIHDTLFATVTPEINMTNTGHVTVTTNSKFWLMRLRGLSDA